MNKKRTAWRPAMLAIFFTVVLCGNYLAGQAQATLANDVTQNTSMAAYAPGELLVGVRTDSLRASSFAAANGVEAVELVEECQSNSTDAATYLLHVAEGDEIRTVAQLQQDSTVLFAEPNWYVYAADIAAVDELSQPETPFQVSDPAYVPEQWYLPRINSGRAWGLAYAAGGFSGNLTTIQVAVVDSGVDINHPDLAGRLLPGKNYVTASSDPDAPPVDKYGHGTHVAGAIGAIINNSIGIAGIAPKVMIDPRKVLDDAGSGTIDNVARGICEAADAGAKVINLSLETPSRSDTLLGAVQYAQDKGALLIAAAGNSGSPTAVAYPAAFYEVMAVAATTYGDTRATYSNYSNTATTIDIAAPGGTSQQPIYSTWAKDAWCNENRAPLPTSGYCNAYGTSMAAAVVTGAAAMVWSVAPDLSAQEVHDLLTESATPIAASRNEVGSGRLDLHAALRRLIPSEIELSKNSIVYTTSTPGSPYTVAVRVENPSGIPINWEAGVVGAPAWIQLAGAGADGVLSGTSSYGHPGHLELVIANPNAAPGSYSAGVQVVGTRTNTTQTVKQLSINLIVGSLTPQLYFPMVSNAPNGTIPPQSSAWEVPSSGNRRTVLTLADDGAEDVSLPFAFPLKGADFTTAQVHANGFVSFTDVASIATTQNKCLDNLDALGEAVYGWWADLDPSAANAQVSTFAPAADRFVIEFVNVPTAAKAGDQYRVNFQIVLYANGSVTLNYGEVPGAQALPPRVTVGIEARDGLFYNQIACKDGNTELGFLPNSYQAITLQTEESIY